MFLPTALLQLLMVLTAVLSTVDCQDLFCGRAPHSTVLHPTTAETAPLVMTCDVPDDNVLGADDDFTWKWDDLAPDNTVTKKLPNVTGATCEF